MEQRTSFNQVRGCVILLEGAQLLDNHQYASRNSVPNWINFVRNVNLSDSNVLVLFLNDLN